MPIPFRRPWVYPVLALVCMLLQGPVQADPPASALAQAPVVTARRLDLGAAATQPLVAGLRQDLGPLLATAAFRRSPAEPDAPRHAITSVDRIIAALRAHRGPAWVALGARRDGGAEVGLQDLYVLEGAPIGGTPPPAPAGAAPAARPGLLLDLQGVAAKPLLESLLGHLGALLPPAGAGAATTVEAVIAALQGTRQLMFVVLAGRDGKTLAGHPQVFVVPDVLRLSISDTAPPSGGPPAATAPAKAVSPGGVPVAEVPEPDALETDAPLPAQVRIVPGAPGQPPRIRVDVDLEQYDATQPPGRP